MKARLHSWRRKIQHHPVTTGEISVAIVGLIAFICIAYGITTAKALWDWLGVLAIPVVIGLSAAWFTTKCNEQQSQTAHETARENQRAAALQSYIDTMSELLLHEQCNPQAETIARARTVTALRILDSVRRGSLIRFVSLAGRLTKCTEDELIGIDLSKANLIQVNLRKANLRKANLSGADLSGAGLTGADLSKSNLSGANLGGTSLSEANLSEANLREASIKGADLSGADLSGADLSGADLSGADLSGADLSGALLIRARINGANLSGAQLSSANLSGATLRIADLSFTNLSFANLSRANLSYAICCKADLSEARLEGANFSYTDLSTVTIALERLAAAKSLRGTTMPDGTKQPEQTTLRVIAPSLPLPRSTLHVL